MVCQDERIREVKAAALSLNGHPAVSKSSLQFDRSVILCAGDAFDFDPLRNPLALLPAEALRSAVRRPTRSLKRQIDRLEHDQVAAMDYRHSTRFDLVGFLLWVRDADHRRHGKFVLRVKPESRGLSAVSPWPLDPLRPRRRFADGDARPTPDPADPFPERKNGIVPFSGFQGIAALQGETTPPSSAGTAPAQPRTAQDRFLKVVNG